MVKKVFFMKGGFFARKGEILMITKALNGKNVSIPLLFKIMRKYNTKIVIFHNLPITKIEATIIKY